MKDDLKRLINEFLEETKEYRRVETDEQLTDKMPPRKVKYLREATLTDFIDWLNDDINNENTN